MSSFVSATRKRRSGSTVVALRVRGALLRHRFATSVAQRLSRLLFEFGLASDCTRDWLCLHKAQETLLRRVATRAIRRTVLVLGAVLNDEVRGKLMLRHRVHWSELGGAVLGPSRTWLHDVREVDPLIASATVTVLSGVGLSARYLADAAHALRMVLPHQHWRLAVPRVRRLRAGKSACVEERASTARGLCIANTWSLDQVDLPAVASGARLISWLKII